MLPPRILSGIALVVDVALLARGQPVSARVLAERQGRAPRHLEALLQDLVRHGFLKGTRGPRGGYVLARERRRINLGDIVRSLAGDAPAAESRPTPARIIEEVILPALAQSDAAALQALDAVTIQDLTARVEGDPSGRREGARAEFHI